ncbi:MAG: glycosyltransferase family 2 protein [Patescibacteria group bacterium]
MNQDYYLKVGRAADLLDKKERALFRFFEILPGAATWLTFLLAILLSWKKPVWVAIFVIVFVIYWFARNIYFFFHLSGCYKKMAENEKINWLARLDELKTPCLPTGMENCPSTLLGTTSSSLSLGVEDLSPSKGWRNIYHLVIIPMYQEPLAVLREVFLALTNCDYPKDKMIVVLACEERVKEEVEKTALDIEKEFSGKFFNFLITWHPSGLLGEISGKGSNENWASKRAKEMIDSLKIPYDRIVYSCFDADTVVFLKYFSCLTYYYLTVKNPTRCSFQPIPLFINNIWQAPPVSRIFAFSASFWEMMCQERPEKLITFSSHSMSFSALVDIDFKQANVVSDDSRIFWQCFFKYDGKYEVIPLYYPVSMDANAAPSFRKTVKNVYLQQRRWAYGVGDIAYFLFGSLKNKKIALSKKISLGFTIFENYWSWATSSVLLFFLGWLPIILGVENFKQTLFSYNLPIFTRNILTLAMMGLVGSIYFSIVLLPPKPIQFGRKKYLFFILEWFLIPIILIFFYALPAIDSQTRWMLGKYLGFWPTPKIRT